VHFAMRWDKKDKHEATCSIVGKCTDLTASQKWTRIAAFEIRGLELLRFHPRTCTVVTMSGTEFTECDVEDAREGWAEFDEKANAPVAVSDLEFRFVAS